MKNVRLSLNTVPQFLEYSIWNIFTCGMDAEVNVQMDGIATIPTRAYLAANPMLSILHHFPSLVINPFCESVLIRKLLLFKISIKIHGTSFFISQIRCS